MTFRTGWMKAVIVAACSTTAQAAAVIRTGSYPVDVVYQAHVAGVGPIGVVSSGSSLAALTGNQVRTIGLPGRTASGPLFTLPAMVGGGPAFPGGFAVSDGVSILTGQTGAFLPLTVAGEVYLTPAAGGATSTLSVNGNFDATVRSGRFVVSAAHGADSHGDSTAVFGSAFGSFQGSGLYAMETAGGALSGLDLLFDTGTFSGAVAADPANGDVYFALGGSSALLSGGPSDFNDIWVIRGAAVQAALGSGVAAASAADYVASIGFNDGITGFAFDPAGRLLVGLTSFAGGIDRIVQFDVNRTNASDYTAMPAGTVAEGSDSSVRMFDFVIDNGVVRISAVPEPASAVLLAGAWLMAVRRRGQTERRA